ncbi:MAG: ABC transporter ATP-binding protein [Chloroflexi bacterium]|jgi:predicted ABC-type transport system involved in lysophospholipase L1 biosynthesis ATPase subunit|nr:ABC transporter ATP-binding protein [Chloroflexota bacterium]
MDMRLDLEHVAKDYPAPAGTGRVAVLRDVSLRVGAGESVAVVGPSGAGKSTLLNIAGALDRPSSGGVRVNGRDLAALSDDELARLRNREVGFVFQLHHLLPQCSALENCLLPTIAANGRGRGSDAPERARRLLDRVGLGTRLHHRPGELSGGECQRVAVARALVMGPALLLADEPTGSLDGGTARELADLLLELNREEGVALVVVTHSLELASRLDRTLALVGGRLQPAGTGRPARFEPGA